MSFFSCPTTAWSSWEHEFRFKSVCRGSNLSRRSEKRFLHAFDQCVLQLSQGEASGDEQCPDNTDLKCDGIRSAQKTANVASWVNLNLNLYTQMSMFPRVVALLLSVLTLWLSLAVTEQRFAEALDLPEQTASVSGDVKRSDMMGSMDDHVVDDQPAQRFAELALDLTALVDDVNEAFFCGALPVGSPAKHADAMRAAPYLEGLRRPLKSA